MFGRVESRRGGIIDKRRADAASLKGTSTSEKERKAMTLQPGV